MVLWDGSLVASVLEGPIARVSEPDGEKRFEAFGNRFHCHFYIMIDLLLEWKTDPLSCGPRLPTCCL